MAYFSKENTNAHNLRGWMMEICFNYQVSSRNFRRLLSRVFEEFLGIRDLKISSKTTMLWILQESTLVAIAQLEMYCQTYPTLRFTHMAQQIRQPISFDVAKRQNSPFWGKACTAKDGCASTMVEAPLSMPGDITMKVLK